MQQAATAPPKASIIIPAARLHPGSGPPSTSSKGCRSRATQVQSHRNPPANRADRSATNVRVIRTSSPTTLTTGDDPGSHSNLVRNNARKGLIDYEYRNFTQYPHHAVTPAFSFGFFRGAGR